MKILELKIIGREGKDCFYCEDSKGVPVQVMIYVDTIELIKTTE
jgi:hypothetical protein